MEKSELPSFEYGLLRTPWEIGFKSLRTAQKAVEKELPPALSFITNLKLKSSSSREECLTRLGKLEDKVANLLKAATQAREDQSRQFKKCKKRLRALDEDSKRIAQLQKAFVWNFNKPLGQDSKYISRLLADYLAASGYIETARSLVKHEGLEDFVDLEVYEELAFHLDRLQEGEVTAALEWCVLYRSALKKKGSTLEATLHLQQYLKLIEEKEYGNAVRYLRQHISPKDLENVKDVSKVVAFAAFQTPPNNEYTQLVGEQRREEIRSLFCQNFRAVFGFSKKPLLEVLMELGFIALLSPVCHERACASCPCCDALWRPLLDALPTCHKSRTALLDPITHEVMDEEKNPPMAAPSGYVYGQQQIASMERVEGEKETVICPMSKQKMKLSEFQRVYVT